MHHDFVHILVDGVPTFVKSIVHLLIEVKEAPTASLLQVLSILPLDLVDELGLLLLNMSRMAFLAR